MVFKLTPHKLYFMENAPNAYQKSKNNFCNISIKFKFSEIYSEYLLTDLINYYIKNIIFHKKPDTQKRMSG